MRGRRTAAARSALSPMSPMALLSPVSVACLYVTPPGSSYAASASRAACRALSARPARRHDPPVAAQPQGQPPQRRRVRGAQGDPQPAAGQLLRLVVRVVLGNPAAARPDLDHDLRVVGRRLDQALGQVAQLDLRRSRRLVEDADLGHPVEAEGAPCLRQAAPRLHVGVAHGEQPDRVDLALGQLVPRRASSSAATACAARRWPGRPRRTPRPPTRRSPTAGNWRRGPRPPRPPAGRWPAARLRGRPLAQPRQGGHGAGGDQQRGGLVGGQARRARPRRRGCATRSARRPCRCRAGHRRGSWCRTSAGRRGRRSARPQ